MDQFVYLLRSVTYVLKTVEEIVAFLEARGERMNAAVLLVDKPAGPTSFGVRRAGARRARRPAA